MNDLQVGFFGAALLLLILALLPVAGALSNPIHWVIVRRSYRGFTWRGQIRQFWASELGAVTVLYFIRNGSGVTINGSATAPTASQAQQCERQRASISMADSDTQALFTHNWGLDASAPTYFDPEILGIAVLGPAQPAQTYLPAFTFDFSNTNVLKVNKLNFLGTGGTYLLTLRRGGSVGQ